MSFSGYLSSVLPAAGTILGTAIGQPVLGAYVGSAIGNYFVQDNSLSQSKAMANHNANLEKQLFDYMNEYNSPENIRQRLEQGGFNPALMYGSGMQGISTSMPSVNGAINRYQGVAIDPLVSAQLELIDSQVQNNNAERRYKDALSGKTTAETATEQLKQTLLSTDNEAKLLSLEIARSTKDSQIQLSIAQTAKMQNEAQKVVAEIDQLFYSCGLTEAQTAKARAELFSIEMANDMDSYRYQIERKLGWMGQPGVQRLLSIGVDGITSLVGIGKFIKLFSNKSPKGKYVNIETGEYFD